MLATIVTLAALLAAAQDVPAPKAPAQHLEVRLADWRHSLGSYSLEMVPAGEVSRNGDAPLGPRQIDPAGRQRLRLVIAQERFFDLKRSYGDALVDGRIREVTIRLDGRRNSVVINDLSETDQPAAEIGRALRVWYTALQVLSDPGSIRVEAQDRPFLDRP